MTKSKQALWVTGALVFAILLGLLIQSVAEGTHYLKDGQKGVAYTFNFSVIDSNSPWHLYGTAPAAADVHVYQDGVSGARATNAVTDRGLFMELTLTIAEMTAVNWVAVEVNDISSPPLYGDEVFYIPIIIGDPCLASTTTSGTVTTAQTGDVYAQLPTNFSSLEISASGIVDSNLLTVEGADATDTLGTAQTGDTYAELPTNFSATVITAGGVVDADVEAIGGVDGDPNRTGYLSVVVEWLTNGTTIGRPVPLSEDISEVLVDASGYTKISDGTGTGQVSLTNGLVGINLDDTAGTLDAAEIGGDAITAAKIAADAIGSSEWATSAIDKLLDDTTDNNKIRKSVAYWITRVKGGDPVDLYVAETAQGGSTNSITLAATASATDNAYRYMLVELKSGTGAPATRTVVSYSGTTKIATVGEDWPGDSPDATTTYTLWAAPSSVYADEGLAQAGDATTITLASTAPDVDDITGWIKLSSGTGAPDTQEIVDYDGATKVLTVTGWSGDSPSTDTYYALIPMGTTVSDSTSPTTLSPDDIKAAMMGAEYDDYDEPGTFGWLLQILLRKP